jgi:glycosyltransferase involved in cell wall biosynthesis
VKRLAVFSHKLFRRTSDGLQTTGGFTIQMDALAPYFEKLVLCVPVVDDLRFRGARLTAPNIEFHPLPHYGGRLDFLRRTAPMWREILAVVNQVDLGLVIIPGYVGTLASILCQLHRFPIFQWVVGDWGRDVRVRRSNRLTRWLAFAVWAPLLDRSMMRLTRNVLTFYNGYILYDQGKPYHLTRVSSSIQEGDFYVRDSSPSPSPPYRLLFVGRLSGEKGVSYLLEATALLIAEGLETELHVVGAGPLGEDLRRQANALSIPDQVHFHGFVPQGAILRQLYRESDLFILPSLQDQQPKVIMEAMSQSLPVVATKVGGIPTIVHNGENGLLVPPAQAEAIATAVRQVLSDDGLRQKLVREGLTHARAHTVEQETAKMIQVTASHFSLE